jgi:hypothetical protein
VVVVAWRQFGESGGIRLRASTNGGATFGPERRVRAPRTPGFEVSLALSGRRILVAWTDSYRVTPSLPRVATSLDLGVTWTSRALDAQPADTYGGSGAEIAASGDRVFAVWLRTDRRTLAGRFSIDGGRTWQPPQVLAVMIDPGLRQRAPFSIAARPDRAAIAWAGPWRAPDAPSPTVTTRVFSAGTWGATTTHTATPAEVDHYGIFGSPDVVLLASARVGLAWTGCQEFSNEDGLSCGMFYEIEDVIWSESLDNGASWTPSTVALPGRVAGGGSFGANVSAAWPSGSVRGLLITRFVDYESRVVFVRGNG